MPDAPTLTPHGIARQIARECLGLRSRHLGRMVTRIYDQALRPHGLTLPQLSLLTAIELMGPVQPAELCEPLGLEKSTLSRNVRLMAARGWVREQPTEHGKGKLLELTPAGEALLLSAAGAWEAAQEEARALLGRESRTTLDRLLGARNG